MKVSRNIKRPRQFKPRAGYGRKFIRRRTKVRKTADSPDLNSVLGDGGLDPNQIAKIMSVISRLKNSSNDSRANLLLALKPLLSVPRREKVDTAIKLLKLIDMLPLLKDSGLFDF